MEKIYLRKDAKITLGPFSLEKLKEKDLKASDLVWYEGLSDWTPAGEIAELKLNNFASPLIQPKTKFSLKTFFKKLFSAGN